jgi:hypothetical protein
MPLINCKMNYCDTIFHTWLISGGPNLYKKADDFEVATKGCNVKWCVPLLRACLILVGPNFNQKADGVKMTP